MGPFTELGVQMTLFQAFLFLPACFSKQDGSCMGNGGRGDSNKTLGIWVWTYPLLSCLSLRASGQSGTWSVWGVSVCECEDG